MEILGIDLFNKYGAIYEADAQPIDTRNFTFEQAVERCYYAASQIDELNDRINKIEGIMQSKKTSAIVNVNQAAMPSIAFNQKNNIVNRKFENFRRSLLGINDDYKENRNYIVSENDKMITKSDMTSKERETYPWRLNTLPFGSTMYILHNNFNDALEKTHHLYYEVFLPCKKRADKLAIDNENNQSEVYADYIEIVHLDTILKDYTPRQRITNLRKAGIKVLKTIVLATTGVALGTAFAVRKTMNSAGKDMFTSPKSNARYQSIETGNIYDEDGNRVPW